MERFDNGAALAGARIQIAVLDLSDAVHRVSARAHSERGTAFFWVWVAIAGVLVVAGAAGFAYCRSHGYDRFTGAVRATRDANGVQIGVDIGCV